MPMGIIFPDCIIDIMDIICPDSFLGIIIIIEFFIPDALVGIITVIFIPETFMGIIVIIMDMFIDAFMGIITIMGSIIMQVMFAGQDSIMGCIIVGSMGVIILHSMLAGQDIIIPWFIMLPVIGSIDAIATIPMQAKSMADVTAFDTAISITLLK